MNNNRNNQQEEMLKALREAIFGMKEELKQSQTNNQILQDNQVKMEQRVEEDRRVTNETMRRNTTSVQTQGEISHEWIRKEQTNGHQSSNTEPKRDVKKENAPPGLTYGVVGQMFFDQGEGKRPNLLIHLGKIPIQY